MIKIKINNEEIMNRLIEDVELVELEVDEEVTPFFDDEFKELEKWINSNVVNTYIEAGQLYINKFYLKLNNNGQAIIRVV